MIRTGAVTLILWTIFAWPSVQAEDRSGEAVWKMHCFGCHRPDGAGPGTVMLKHRYGEPRAYISANPDLNRDYVKQVVRNGLIEMPPFRPSEISDGELDSLIDFLLSD